MSKIGKPLPPTGSIPEAGRLFFRANRAKSYALARAGAIVTLDTGSRAKAALLHETARKVGIDPMAPPLGLGLDPA
jgi:hypothetical protein